MSGQPSELARYTARKTAECPVRVVIEGFSFLFDVSWEKARAKLAWRHFAAFANYIATQHRAAACDRHGKLLDDRTLCHPTTPRQGDFLHAKAAWKIIGLHLTLEAPWKETYMSYWRPEMQARILFYNTKLDETVAYSQLFPPSSYGNRALDFFHRRCAKAAEDEAKAYVFIKTKMDNRLPTQQDHSYTAGRRELPLLNTRDAPGQKQFTGWDGDTLKRSSESPFGDPHSAHGARYAPQPLVGQAPGGSRARGVTSQLLAGGSGLSVARDPQVAYMWLNSFGLGSQDRDWVIRHFDQHVSRNSSVGDVWHATGGKRIPFDLVKNTDTAVPRQFRAHNINLRGALGESPAI